MSDFAAAAMMRLIRLGLARQGLATAPPEAVAPPAPDGRRAHVALAAKRAWLARLWTLHGPQVLVRIGEAVHEAPDEPAMAALSAARDPHDLVERWQRLERFIHSRHRIQVLEAGAGGLRLHHVAQSGAAPLPAEDALVMGLLLVLCTRCGATALRARVQGERAWRLTPDGWAARTWPADLATWELAWQPPPPTTRERRMAATKPADGDWVASVRARLAADPGQRWTLQRLGAQLGCSPRSLRRHLQQGQQHFSGLLAEARLAQAARLLVAGELPTAAVAYVCGYADQAHFTREFKRGTAITPAQFRQQFAALS